MGGQCIVPSIEISMWSVSSGVVNLSLMFSSKGGQGGWPGSVCSIFFHDKTGHRTLEH